MIKKIATLFSVFCISTILFAYNPPVGGESLDTLTTPTALTYANSATGGGIFSAGPDSIMFNPALIAGEQRISIDAAFTALFSTFVQPNRFSVAAETGITIPTKWLSFGALLKGSFASFEEMNTKNTIGTNLAIAKAISERLSVGFGLNAGAFWGAGADWSLGANIGMMYRMERLGFMRDFRIGASVLNLGKTYTKTELTGLNSEKPVGWFPMLGTTKVGVAALLFSNEHVKGGFSFDLTTPGFQNLIVSLGFQFSVKDVFFVRLAEDINIQEAATKHYNFMPAIGLGCKFRFKSGKGQYMEDKGWAESEMSINATWKQLYQTLNAFSTNVRIDVGKDDKDPPKIELWFDEEDN
ncbi:MAG: hypothetical protein IKI31_06465 [Treponema sp.]|nr:hypothetical protein [Treponema sp.]